MPLPSPAAAKHSTRVVAHIAAEIARADGWIPFDRYMQLALYAPELGYYVAGAHKFGDSAAGGDFVTAPEISPLFAQALARQFAQLFEQAPPQIVEFGPVNMSIHKLNEHVALDAVEPLRAVYQRVLEKLLA